MLFSNLTERVTITDRNQINRVLNTIGNSKATSHMFIPSGGGVDIMGILPTYENG